MESVADDIGPETAVRPPPRNPAAPPSATSGPAASGGDRLAAPGRAVVTERRYRQTIHRVDLWSVLKISVCFYICGMAVTMVALVALWAIADAAGVIHSVEKFFGRPAADEGLHLPRRCDPPGRAARVGGARGAPDRHHGDRGRVLQRVLRAVRRDRDHASPRTSPLCRSRAGSLCYARPLPGAIAQSVRAHP